MADLLQHLKTAAGARVPDGVHIAPNLDPKKLANAVKWAPCGNETPLVLIDDSVWSSGKAGALITDRALYLDEPRLRIELSWLQHPPSYPEGPSEAPRVSTPHGEVTLKKMLLDDVHAAWSRMLSAIVNVNTGRAVGPATMAPIEGPLGELALKHLVHDDILLAPSIPQSKLHKAAAHFREWLDYVNGERLIAYLDETALGAGDEGVALTDRRLLARIGDDKHFMVPYGALVSVDGAKGFMEKKLAINAGPYSGQIPLITCGGAVENVVTFLRGVMQLHPNQRWAPSPSYVTANDPTGASELAAALIAPDPRVTLMLRYVYAAASRGVMSVDTARDLVERVHVMHQTLTFGRGAQNGFRISPLHGADLSFLLEGVFGGPIGVSGDATTRVMDFSIERRGSNVGAAASSAVGLAMLAVVGVGWVSTPGKTIQGVRMMLRDLGRGTGFVAQGALRGVLMPLEQVEPAVLGWVLDALDDLEALTLLERAVFGWQLSPEQLFGIDPNTLAHHVQSLLGPVDLSPFQPG